MSQADSANTTIPSRISFASAGAVRTRPSPTARELANDIRGAHAHLIERITAVSPNVINPFLQAEEDDLKLRADHLRIVLRATADYVGALMHDTAYFSHAVQIERKRVDGIFDDVIGDLCGAIENVAETVREERAYRAA